MKLKNEMKFVSFLIFRTKIKNYEKTLQTG